MKMQSTSVFFDVAKFVDSRWKNADFNKTQVVSLVIYIISESSLDKE